MDFRHQLTTMREYHGIRLFNPIPCLPAQPDTKLSIQASEHHYCEPQKLLHDLDQYTSWEIVILTDGVPSVPTSQKLADYLPYWSGDCVAGFVPTAVVQQIFERICPIAQRNN